MPTIETASSWYPPSDPVHGFDHVLRVYRLAERLAQAEGADLEIVRAAVLLHDATPDPAVTNQPINEPTNTPTNQLPNQPLLERSTHHHASAAFARWVLLAEGWPEERIAAVEHCIRAHRFRDDREQPQTLEAKVLFDADKLDAIGAIGVARAIAYAARAGCPPYGEPSADFIESGRLASGELHSSYHEFLFKLRKLKDRMYTASARQMAEERHRRMETFYSNLAAETRGER